MKNISKEDLEVLDRLRGELGRAVGDYEPNVNTVSNGETMLLASKKTLSRLLDISCSEIDRLIREGKFYEGKHYTRYSDGGHKRFDVAECYEALKPERAGSSTQKAPQSRPAQSNNNARRKYR
jgi:hypothetical protein